MRYIDLLAEIEALTSENERLLRDNRALSAQISFIAMSPTPETLARFIAHADTEPRTPAAVRDVIRLVAELIELRKRIAELEGGGAKERCSRDEENGRRRAGRGAEVGPGAHMGHVR